MKKAIYAGSFDPITLGHLDIIKRSLDIFDEIIIAIGNNLKKKYMFDCKDRINFIKTAVTNENINENRINIKFFDGLLIDLAKKENVKVLIRGVRVFHDFDYEYQMALINQNLSSDVNTIFLIARPEFIVVSSSVVKELIHFNKDISKYVPKSVVDFLNTVKE